MEEIIVDGTENYSTLKSDYIFDQEKLHTFELTIPEENLKFLNDDPAREEYVDGKLTFEGEEIAIIGIRYKGSIGAFVNCVSGNNWANPSGRKVCTKLSMKLKINYTDKDKKFYGLKKLQFHSMNLDPSQMRDRLGYHLFRKMDVIAPRSTHCRLVINGEYSGLYALVENIDGRFVKQNFDNDDGNLYKEIWPLDSNGEIQNQNRYINALETNEELNNVSQMENFAKAIMNTSIDSLEILVSKWMVPEDIISYVVVDRLIKNDDGVFHWYCNGNNCAPHNYFWYEDDEDLKMHLIPWDLDNAFENITNSNAVTAIADGWDETSNNCNPFKFGGLQLKQKSAACDKLIMAWTLYDELYKEKKQEFINGAFSEVSVNEVLDTWAEQINAATIEAKEKHDDAISVNRWESEIQKLKDALEVMRR
jgi:spore coat protein CotH